MMRAPELRAWLEAADGRAAGASVIVAGGGALADQVRGLQAAWQFDERLAHELALETMRMNASILAAILPRARLTSAVNAERLATAGAVWIWSPPRPFIAPALPWDWTATSDSIALWLAQSVGAAALILVKSVAADTLRDAPAETFAKAGLIDTCFPRLLAQSPLPARVLAKTQHAEFARARAERSLFGARIGSAASGDA